MTTDIKDNDGYLSRMRRSMYDKMFFVDVIEPTKNFIDFGCADGDMLKHLHFFYPSSRMIGVEENKKFRSKIDFESSITFAGAWEMTGDSHENTTLVLSSALHEIYNYKSSTDIAYFWSLIQRYRPKNIVIRDMCYKSSDWYGTSSPEATRAVHCYYSKSARVNPNPNWRHLDQWQEKWGSIETRKSLIHLLLTYKYVDNWERELKENYFCDWQSDVAALFMREYACVLSIDFTPPYLDSLIRKDFGLKPEEWRGTDTTHSKVILVHR